jgi:hypothetical protein
MGYLSSGQIGPGGLRLGGGSGFVSFGFGFYGRDCEDARQLCGDDGGNGLDGF